MSIYGDLEGALAYHQARGNVAWSADSVTDTQRAAALTRATSWVDSYRSRLPGRKADGRGQELEWPRVGAADAEGNEIAEDEIPIEVEQATYEAALRELVEPGSLFPDLERGGAVKRLKAGSVEVEYADSASLTTTFTAIEAILEAILTPASGATVDLLRV
ncbi:DnaT-like ssDNA-binding protein [Afipia carboxidovorans]|uniref:DnaT-like ssDNA-binding protein n=1 Tax=Afipia carboxidovorans TaxID=40137 RepID=UPI003089C937|nr:hypothetical protein CRBSH125_01120 [Afipia carboxidovorans]